MFLIRVNGDHLRGKTDDQIQILSFQQKIYLKSVELFLTKIGQEGTPQKSD